MFTRLVIVSSEKLVTFSQNMKRMTQFPLFGYGGKTKQAMSIYIDKNLPLISPQKITENGMKITNKITLTEQNRK